ncbi:MAG: hypothetical protein NTY45_12870 [Elusimicrobia bacterium]|nr:hypothetical protein [Elusimicrobiota bacterium]
MSNLIIIAMKLPLALLLLLPVWAGAYPYDARLSARLKGEFDADLRANAVGRELFGRLGKAGPAREALRVLVRTDPAECFASFDPDSNAIYFNSRFILKFFAAKGFKDRRLVELLSGNKKARAVLVKYAAPVYLHELVHALQFYLYPEYRQDAGANPLEWEYEAYLTEDMFVHERMKADPALLKAFITGAYTDLYTANILGSYFTLSLDKENYKERIRRYYEEGVGGYMSMEKAESAKKNNVADAKIMAYAAGAVGEYEKDSSALARLGKEKEDYARFLDDFYASRWPAFSADALLFVGSMALAEKNYPLALDCLAVADVNSQANGLDPAALNTLKTKGALAILEAASYLRDNSKKMDIELLSRHLKALEKACVSTARPFPDDLVPMKKLIYPKAMAFFAKKYAAEKQQARKDYYKENMDYFAAACANPGEE